MQRTGNYRWNNRSVSKWSECQRW